MLLRGFPVIGWAWTAWELYNLWKDWQGAYIVRPPVGYTKVAEYPLQWLATIGTPQDKYAGFVYWHYEGYLGGVERTWYATGSPDIIRAAHYWWERVEPGKPEYAPLYAVKSKWEWDWSVPEPLALPPRPLFIPWINPIPIPGVPLLPLAPMPVPLPLPVRLPGVFIPPDVHNPDPAGYQEPGLRYRRRPRQQTQEKLDERPAQARRPKRKEKERKVTGSKKHLKFLGWILSQFSEVGDLVDALHSALPDHLQVQGSINDKLKALYQHWLHVDMNEAVHNMIQDMITDPKFAGVFEEMQERQEEFGLDLGGLKGLEGSSGIWTAR